MAEQITLQAVKERVARVREAMARAAVQAGRKPEDIALCGVVKGQVTADILLSRGMPIDCYGENRAQELQLHLSGNAFLGKPCHFIGHLQTNKLRQVVGSVSLIQSVDSHKLLRAIEGEADRQGIVQDVLLQINIGEESSKTGAPRAALMPLLEAAASSKHLRARGLMAIPPAFDNSPESRRWFREMRALFEQALASGIPGGGFETLSMGMTDSFEAAILEGATLVRVGTGIFGARKPKG